MSTHRLTRPAALGLTLAALAAPAAVAEPIDLRSPDTRDAARAAEARQEQPRQDLRSPDARDAAQTSSLVGTTSTPRQDLRLPDTRDYADGRGTFNAPEVTVVRVAEPAAPANGGIDWGDAGIGAGAAFGITLLGLGGALAVVQYRDVARRRTATTG
jgi:hypothetical protein